jgi:hypothetical protein
MRALPTFAILFAATGGLVAPAATNRAEVVYHVISNAQFVASFAQPPKGWMAGFRSTADWRGERGFSEKSRASSETGIGWFSMGGSNLYRGIRAPRDANHAILEGQYSADHTQLTGLDARKRTKKGEQLEIVTGQIDLTVAVADDGTPRTRDLLNCFFQIFERSTEHGWRPAYGLFFKNERLLVGAWDDNPAVPGLELKRGQWYRIRFSVGLRHDGARTLMSVWPVDAGGRQGEPLASCLVIDHAKGLRLQGLARSFPVMVGSYTWAKGGRTPFSAATLISDFRQDDNLDR